MDPPVRAHASFLDGRRETIQTPLAQVEEPARPPTPPTPADSDDEAEAAAAYGAAMDAELAQTGLAQSFERAGEEPGDSASLAPVDVDFNLVKSLLESVEAQDGGAPGAAGLLLSELGVSVQPDDVAPASAWENAKEVSYGGEGK